MRYKCVQAAADFRASFDECRTFPGIPRSAAASQRTSNSVANSLRDETLSDHPDVALISRLRSGDHAAWDLLFTTYSESVWRYVAKLLGSEVGAVADVVQETFQAVLQSIGQFDAARGTLRAWMMGIAHNRAMLHWRSRRKDRHLHSLDQLLADSNGRLTRWFDTADSETSPLELQESAELVRQVLAELPEEYSYCLVAKYVDDRSAAEIADDIGESIDAVRSRLTRARSAFRERIQRAATERDHAAWAKPAHFEKGAT